MRPRLSGPHRHPRQPSRWPGRKDVGAKRRCDLPADDAPRVDVSDEIERSASWLVSLVVPGPPVAVEDARRSIGSRAKCAPLPRPGPTWSRPGLQKIGESSRFTDTDFTTPPPWVLETTRSVDGGELAEMVAPPDVGTCARVSVAYVTRICRSYSPGPKRSDFHWRSTSAASKFDAPSLSARDNLTSRTAARGSFDETVSGTRAPESGSRTYDGGMLTRYRRWGLSRPGMSRAAILESRTHRYRTRGGRPRTSRVGSAPVLAASISPSRETNQLPTSQKPGAPRYAV